MYKILYSLILFILLTSNVYAQGKNNFEVHTKYKYEVNADTDSFTEENVLTKWTLHKEPFLWLELIEKVNSDRDQYRYRLKNVKLLKNLPDKKVYQFIPVTYHGQKILYTYYKGDSPEVKIGIFINKQSDGSYKGVIYFTSYKVDDFSDLLD